MAVDLGFLLSWFPYSPYIILPCLTFLIFFYNSKKSTSPSPTDIFPKSYPIIGSVFALLANRDRHNQWAAEVLNVCPTNTYVLRYIGMVIVTTAYPDNVKHILKSNFSNYPKGGELRGILSDFLGDGIFNADGDSWKFQRQISSHEFNSTSLRKFIEEVVKIEISDRLVPVLSMTAEKNTVLDFQDILQRFAFDYICKISFGYDPSYLSLSLEKKTEFAVAFEDGTRIMSERIGHIFQLYWKVKRFLNIGSEKRLKQATATIRESARKIVRQKKNELNEKSSLETTDLLSRFVKDDKLDEDFVIDIVISFILAGQDTSSAALTWFFWLVSCNPQVEKEILKEISQIAEEPGYDDIKNMVYIHVSLCESMRLYPPVPYDSKEAAGDDIFPDGTIIKKGDRVSFSVYAMGRMDNLWGLDSNEFKPERWLQKDNATGKLSFVSKDSFAYPVFQAGPRICLGKEMAFLQMKMIVVEVFRRFKVVPAAVIGNDFVPEFGSYLTSKMKGGFPVKIQKRTA
ncbi:hypothetical protein C5167_025724 [Papaver somniferum]|uniref:Cytochrome P450 n=1 Tax=Papaver somniferum TaxID=3469 RepID=A0A4Y7JTT4_PAPSO|nr:cytochrome P450 94A1-like [Papaver somniferum]RZC63966.1 hypothetical protein C5167_025724 [Papaver somniferum]